MEGKGEADNNKDACESANLELAGTMQAEFEAVKFTRQMQKQALRKDQVAKMKAAGLNPQWSATLCINLNLGGRIVQASQTQLDQFVTKHLLQATSAKGKYIMGMDTEGQGMTYERKFNHAQFMQIAGASNNECVVFRTTRANLNIAMSLFRHFNIIIDVAGKNEDCRMLKELFIPVDEFDWTECIADVQLLGQEVLKMKSKPSLETMVSRMLRA